MTQKWKVFQQRYYRDINTLRPFRPVLLSGNVQSEKVAAEESVQKTILLEPYHFKPM